LYILVVECLKSDVPLAIPIPWVFKVCSCSLIILYLWSYILLLLTLLPILIETHSQIKNDRL